VSGYQTEPPIYGQDDDECLWPRGIDQRTLARMQHDGLDWLAVELERMLRTPGGQRYAMKILDTYRRNIPAA